MLALKTFQTLKSSESSPFCVLIGKLLIYNISLRAVTCQYKLMYEAEVKDLIMSKKAHVLSHYFTFRFNVHYQTTHAHGKDDCICSRKHLCKCSNSLMKPEYSQHSIN